MSVIKKIPAYIFKPRHMFSVAVKVTGRHIANIFSLLFYEM